MPPYTITPCAPSDAPGIANANMRSFYQDPHWALLWPGMTIEEIVEGNRLRLPRQLTKGRDIKRHEMAVDNETGKVVGYARWVLLNTDDEFNARFWLEAQVGEATAEEAEHYEKTYKEGTDEDGRPLGVNKEMTGGNDTSLEDRCKKITDSKPWLELDHIGTIPTHGRRGVGGLLLESGIKVADAAGIPIFVMAYPHGLGLYQKHGSEVLDEYSRDDTKYGGVGLHVVSFLVRPVGGSVKPQSIGRFTDR